MTENTNIPEISVIILCYKAGDSIREFVKKTIDILKINQIFDYQLVLVANYHEGSNDQTPKVVIELANNDPKILTVTRPKQGMMGWDMKSGMEASTGNYLAVIDGDGQMPVEDLIKVYQKIKKENLDLAKTYRIVRGDGVWRKFLSLTYNLIFKILFIDTKAKDVNSKPKIISRESYQKLNLESDDWFIDAEIMIQAGRLKFKVGEIPTTFKGLEGNRKSFVGLPAILEFIKNLIIYWVKEFSYRKK